MAGTDYFHHPVIKLYAGLFAKKRVVLRDDFISVEEAAFVGFAEVERIFYDDIAQVYRYAGRYSPGVGHFLLSIFLFLLAALISLGTAVGGAPLAMVFILPLPVVYLLWVMYRGVIAREVMLQIVHRRGRLVLPGARAAGGFGSQHAQEVLLKRLRISLPAVIHVRELPCETASPTA